MNCYFQFATNSQSQGVQYFGLKPTSLQVIKSINKPNDCQIAFYAIHFKEQLVHNDKDFVKIARHTSLKVY